MMGEDCLQKELKNYRRNWKSDFSNQIYKLSICVLYLPRFIDIYIANSNHCLRRVWSEKKNHKLHNYLIERIAANKGKMYLWSVFFQIYSNYRTKCFSAVIVGSKSHISNWNMIFLTRAVWSDKNASNFFFHFRLLVFWRDSPPSPTNDVKRAMT